MNKKYICCPKCGKKLFRIENDSKYHNIYVWCKKCCEEIKVTEPKSQTSK